MEKEFKKELRAWRKSRGFVQKEAADFLKVNKRTYEGWEYGRTCPLPLAMAELKRRMEAKSKPNQQLSAAERYPFGHYWTPKELTKRTRLEL